MRTTAKTRNRIGCVGTTAYATAEAKDKANPIMLILLGVKCSLYAMFASVPSISWICFLSLVSNFVGLLGLAVFIAQYWLAIIKSFQKVASKKQFLELEF
jgi:hypothetical protein